MVAGNVSNRTTHTSSVPTKDGSFRHPGVGNIRNPEGPVIPEEYCKDRFTVRGSPLGYFQSNPTVNAESNSTVSGFITFGASRPGIATGSVEREPFDRSTIRNGFITFHPPPLSRGTDL